VVRAHVLCGTREIVYHWIVQRVGSAVIIQWGQEYTFEDAHSTVSAYLENLDRADKKKA
jgi:hypothetical protein